MRLLDLIFIVAICSIALYLVSCTVPYTRYVYLEKGQKCTVMYKQNGKMLSVTIDPDEAMPVTCIYFDNKEMPECLKRYGKCLREEKKITKINCVCESYVSKKIKK